MNKSLRNACGAIAISACAVACDGATNLSRLPKAEQQDAPCIQFATSEVCIGPDGGLVVVNSEDGGVPGSSDADAGSIGSTDGGMDAESGDAGGYTNDTGEEGDGGHDAGTRPCGHDAGTSNSQCGWSWHEGDDCHAGGWCGGWEWHDCGDAGSRSCDGSGSCGDHDG